MKNTGRNDIKSILGIFKKLIDADSWECGVFSLEKGFLGKAPCACEIASDGTDGKKGMCSHRIQWHNEYSLGGAHKIDLTFSSWGVEPLQVCSCCAATLYGD